MLYKKFENNYYNGGVLTSSKAWNKKRKTIIMTNYTSCKYIL